MLAETVIVRNEKRDFEDGAKTGPPASDASDGDKGGEGAMGTPPSYDETKPSEGDAEVSRHSDGEDGADVDEAKKEGKSAQSPAKSGEEPMEHV